jgi:hypothetical protein
MSQNVPNFACFRDIRRPCCAVKSLQEILYINNASSGDGTCGTFLGAVIGTRTGVLRTEQTSAPRSPSPLLLHSAPSTQHFVLHLSMHPNAPNCTITAPFSARFLRLSKSRGRSESVHIIPNIIRTRNLMEPYGHGVRNGCRVAPGEPGVYPSKRQAPAGRSVLYSGTSA